MIATLGDGTALGTLAALAVAAIGAQQRSAAKREEENARRTRELEESFARRVSELEAGFARRVRELEADVSDLQDENAKLSRENGTLTERADSLRRALQRYTEEANGG